MIRYRRVCLCGVLLSAGVACSSPDLSGPPTIDPTQLYWTIALSSHAITMSTVKPYDTLQLVAVARSATGAPLSGAPTPTFTTTDSSVRVSATGLLTARAPRTNVFVIADLIYQGIHMADTAVITVTEDVPQAPFAHLQIALVPGDSVKIAEPADISTFFFPGTKTLLVAARTASGAYIPNTQVALQLSDTLSASISNQIVTDTTADVTFSSTTARLGPMTVYATSTVYGVTKRDSLQIVITTPLAAGFNITLGASPGQSTLQTMIAPLDTVVIGIGGIVRWVNLAPDSADIVFDDPSAASAQPSNDFLPPPDGAGNIATFAGSTTGTLNAGLTNLRIRQFRRAGTFHFHSVRVGVSGTVIVR